MLKCVQSKKQQEIKLKRSSGARTNTDFSARPRILIFILQVMGNSEGFFCLFVFNFYFFHLFLLVGG